MGKFSSTQLYALVVGVAVIAIVGFLIANGTFDFGSSDDENDSLAVPSAQADGGERPDDADADGGDAQANSSAEEADEDGAVAAAGLQTIETAFQFGDLRVIITDIRISDRVGQEGDETLALERLARLRLSARNTGLEPFTLDGALLLIDGQGRRFTPNVAATANAARVDSSRGNALTQGLQPGITTDLVVAFDVPKEAEDFRLRISGGYVEVALDR